MWQCVCEREDERGDGTEEVAAGRRGAIYGLREIAVADQLRARSPRQFPRKKETVPHDLACGYDFPSVAAKDPIASLTVLSGAEMHSSDFRVRICNRVLRAESSHQPAAVCSGMSRGGAEF